MKIKRFFRILKVRLSDSITVIDRDHTLISRSTEIVPLKRGKLGRAPIWDSDDENEDSDTRTNGEASEIMENTAEKRSVDENEEIFPDSQG